MALAEARDAGWLVRDKDAKEEVWREQHHHHIVLAACLMIGEERGQMMVSMVVAKVFGLLKADRSYLYQVVVIV